MSAVSIQVRDEAHWRELRAKHVGGSESPALFGEHPNLTPFELFHRKKGTIPEPDLSDNDRVFFGSLLEPAIAAGVSKKNPEWTVRKVRRYLSNPEVGTGGSADYEILGIPSRGPGILEIKCADWIVVKNWEDGLPPLRYELQIQHYLSLTGWSWGCMAVLVGGNELRMFEYERRPSTIAIIEAKVAEFWQSIRENREPKPDFGQDGATISSLYGSTVAGKMVDFSSSNRLPELLAEYEQAAAQEKAGKSAREAAKAEILTIIGDTELALCGQSKISCKMIAETDIAYRRKSYRDFRITKRKVEAAA